MGRGTRYELRTVEKVEYASMPGVSTFWFTKGNGLRIREGGRSDVRNFPKGTTALCVFSETSAWVSVIARVTEVSEDGRPLGCDIIVSNRIGRWEWPTEADTILDMRG